MGTSFSLFIVCVLLTISVVGLIVAMFIIMGLRDKLELTRSSFHWLLMNNPGGLYGIANHDIDALGENRVGVHTLKGTKLYAPFQKIMSKEVSAVLVIKREYIEGEPIVFTVPSKFITWNH